MQTREERERRPLIKENAAALIYHVLHLEVYEAHWAPVFSPHWVTHFACVDVPVVISDQVH